MTSGTRRKALIGAVVVAALAAGAVAAVVVRNREPAGPRRTVDAFLAAWARFDTAAMAGLVDRPPEDLAATVAAMRDDLRASAARLRAGEERRDGDRADVDYAAELDLDGLGTWPYTGVLHLVRTSGEWRVEWDPSTLHPSLRPGLRFDRTRTWPARAPILGADGSPLAATGEVVEIGLAPGRITDRPRVDMVLGRQLGVTPAEITAALDAPGVQPDHFVAVATVRADRFAALRPVLEPVPGVFFQRGSGRLSPSDGFAAHTVGRVGEITAERLDELEAPYVVGDEVGLSGLEANFERELAGTPSGEVRLVDAEGNLVEVLYGFTGTAPQPVRTTLDPATQQAGEAALAGVTTPAALVAVDSTTGDIRAIVSRPLDEPFNRALAGQYPPGSTFKVVTTAAVLAAGTAPETAVACPPQATIGGQGFRNFEGEALGATTFRTAFAQSCNTTFVTLAADLPAGALAERARTFGFGASYELPLPVAGGQFPEPRDVAERVSQAIGQGRVVASPVHMATVAATVASGTWRPPRLLSDSPPGGGGTSLDPAVAATLRDLMGEVVRTGTGTAAAVAGEPVAGKTGTAEIGGPDPERTHAWFIGFQDTLAFAVLVEGGGVGGRVAAPVANRFLSALRQ